jgi:GTP cyclohydrolase FolE2
MAVAIDITIDIAINTGYSLIRYLDSNLANDSADHKSQGDYVCLTNNGGISWQSRKPSVIAMSTLNTRFIPCSEASREAKWLLPLQKDIHSSKKDSPLVAINCHNQRARTHIMTGIIKDRTKHIDVCYHNSHNLHGL